MALGDGIRRDIATVSDIERARFIDAIVKLDTTKFFPDGVSYWDKQEEIHKNAHFAGVDVHGGPAFIPWHRVIVNRLEGLLREVDPELSLHYWDWTTDPRAASAGRVALFTPTFMGNAAGDAGHLLAGFESSEDAELGNGHAHIWRQVGAARAKADGTPDLADDATILGHPDWPGFAAALSDAHNITAHTYIGGTIINPHYSFHDPFVFLLHSNLDRLWAKWQTEPGHPERMNPATAYAGLPPSDLMTLATEHVEPWAGGTGLEPWASDPTKRAVVSYTDVSVVAPPCYDTNGSTVEVLAAENPFDTATSRYQVTFNSVPEEETTWRSAVIRAYACGDTTIRVKPGTEPAAPFSVVTPSVVAHHGTAPYADIRVWFEFTAGAVGTAPQLLGPVDTTLECVETGEEFEFELTATTIHRPTVAVELVLDQSGSMADPAGTSGSTRLQVLKDAATLFADLLQRNNGVGLVRFDQDAYPPNDPTYPGLAIRKVMSSSFGDATRVAARSAIAAHGAYGSTSVGDGLALGRSELAALPAGSYDKKALVVLTDGLENTPQLIADVASSIDDTVFAVGLGNETQVNTFALSQLAGSTGGYLLLSGLLASSLDDEFRLRKFFLQILAGVTNTSIVQDPVGYVPLGSRVKVPFVLNEADISARAILLTDLPVVSLGLETPDGQLVDEGSAAAFGVDFELAPKVRTASFGLPVMSPNGPLPAGTWHAVLEIDTQRRQAVSVADRTHGESSAFAGLKTNGAKYCLSVHAFSNLRMAVNVSQTGFTPGSTVNLRAVLTEYAQPVTHRAAVRADVEYPDHSHATVTLAEGAPGTFDGAFAATQAGIYRIHVLAEGGTFRGAAFTREQIATAAVWPGGDRPDPRPDGGDHHEWCRLLACLLNRNNLGERFEERLKEEGVNLAGIRRCVAAFCRHDSHKD